MHFHAEEEGLNIKQSLPYLQHHFPAFPYLASLLAPLRRLQVEVINNQTAISQFSSPSPFLFLSLCAAVRK